MTSAIPTSQNSGVAPAITPPIFGSLTPALFDEKEIKPVIPQHYDL